MTQDTVAMLSFVLPLGCSVYFCIHFFGFLTLLVHHKQYSGQIIPFSLKYVVWSLNNRCKNRHEN